MPRSTPRIVRRGNAYYFRMAVPRHLTHRLQGHEIKISLRTADPLLARLRGTSLSSVFDAFLHRNRSFHLNGLQTTTYAMASERRLREAFISCFCYNRNLVGIDLT